MNADAIIRRLQAFSSALPSAVAGVATEEARFKPPSGAWSILEIVCHLGDEEEDDFRTRLQLTLRDPTAQWPGLDPEGAARDRRYNEQDLQAAVARFVAERAKSVAWLRMLPASTDWARAHVHPKFGPIAAGDLLVSWAAHDALHLRQIAKRLFELAGRDGPGFRTGYAGEWGP